MYDINVYCAVCNYVSLDVRTYVHLAYYVRSVRTCIRSYVRIFVMIVARMHRNVLVAVMYVCTNTLGIRM
jgi:hypothetical protein